MRMPRSTRFSTFLALSAMVLMSCAGPVEESQAEPMFEDGWAFSYRLKGTSDVPALDLRSMNETTAGKSGFVKLTPDGNGFALGDGTPVRFWAVGSEVYTQPSEAIARHVKFLARIGVNMVRLHADITPKQPGSKVTDVDEEQIDGIWRFVAAAKTQGIYTTISPYWAHTKAPASWGIDGYADLQPWGLLFFNETLQKGYKSWARALFARKNPYTGIPLAKDPAVALIQVQNEDSMLFWTFMILKEPQKRKLAGLYAAWLIEKYKSLDAARKAWSNVRVDGDDPASGKVGLIPMWELVKPQSGGMAVRSADDTEFIATLERRFYESIGRFYREELGCGQLLNGSNWRSADPERLNESIRWAYAGLDVIATNHYYNGGAHNGVDSEWAVDPGDKFSQRSGLFEPRGLPTNLKQVVGHPMIVTEGSWVTPMVFQSEGPFLTAVYNSLSGVDAFYWFTTTVPDYATDPFFPWKKVDGQMPLMKYSVSIPPIVGGFPAAALLFRKGYVKQGEAVVHEERTLQSLWDREIPRITEDTAFDPNRDRGNPTVTSSGVASKPVDPLAFLVGPVEEVLGGDPSKSRVADLSKFIDRDKKLVRSNTGEVTLDFGKGFCTVNTPKAQGACGFLSAAGMIKLTDLSIDSANAYATILAVPLDDKPLAGSSKVLIQVTTVARPTGWQTKDVEYPSGDKKSTVKGFQVVNTGKPPWQVADTVVGIALKNPGLTKATLLDTAGYKAEDVPIKKTKTGVSLTLPPETMYLLIESQ